MSGVDQDREVGVDERFFTSRWIEVPEHVAEAGSGLPSGFRAAGVACGIKPDGAPDLGLMVSDQPSTTSAARFTRSGTQSAPVLVTTERARLDAIRVVVVNSGNANAATGASGLEHAARMQSEAALATSAGTDQVAVASTGVIGVPLPIHPVLTGIGVAARELAPDSDAAVGA